MPKTDRPFLSQKNTCINEVTVVVSKEIILARQLMIFCIYLGSCTDIPKADGLQEKTLNNEKQLRNGSTSHVIDVNLMNPFQLILFESLRTFDKIFLVLERLSLIIACDTKALPQQSFHLCVKKCKMQILVTYR